jgi:hypothetical protein
LTPKLRIVLPSILLIGMCLSGCQKPADYTSTVKVTTDDEKPIADCASSGFSWTFETKVDQQTFTDVAVVRGPTRVGGQDAILVETKRNGQLVLREAYRVAKGMLTLTAFSTSAKQWVVLDPPLPLVKDGARLGDEYLWNGKLRIDGKSIDAHGLSRPRHKAQAVFQVFVSTRVLQLHCQMAIRSSTRRRAGWRRALGSSAGNILTIRPVGRVT